MSRISGAANIDYTLMGGGGSPIDLTALLKLMGQDLVQIFGTLPNLAPATETVVATYTPGVGETLRIKGIFAEGENDGLIKLYVNGVVVWQARNAWTERNTPILMEAEAGPGKVIALKITNLKNQNSDYSGGFYGYKI